MTTEPEHQSSLLSRLRNYFFTGVLVTVPAVLSLYVVWIVITNVDNTIKGLLPRVVFENTIISVVPGIGIVLVLAALTLVGAFMAGFVGRSFLRIGERIVDRMPIIRGLYGAIKQIMESLLAPKGKAFDRVVLIEYPYPGSWAMGFVTGNTAPAIQKDFAEEMVNVFVPTTPLPTQGFLLFLPAKKTKPLSITVDQGLKLLVSIGMIPANEGKTKNI